MDQSIEEGTRKEARRGCSSLGRGGSRASISPFPATLSAGRRRTNRNSKHNLILVCSLGMLGDVPSVALEGQRSLAAAAKAGSD